MDIKEIKAKHEKLIERVINVVNSCETKEQLKSALKYTQLYWKILDNEIGDYYFLQSLSTHYSGQSIGALKIKLLNILKK